MTDRDALNDMLERAGDQLGDARAGTDAGDGRISGDPAQPVAITVENFPGLCMGASMLMSLSLHKIGFAPLTEAEGKSLTAALLKNAEAWDLARYIENPKVAAGLDLGGCLVAIMLPRILADAKKKPSQVPSPAPASVDAAPPGLTSAPAPTSTGPAIKVREGGDGEPASA